MPRTPEMQEAEEELQAAIEKMQHVSGQVVDSDNQILTGFLIFTVNQGFEPDGTGNARYNWMVKEGAMPWHAIIGLCEIGSRLLRDGMDAAYMGEED